MMYRSSNCRLSRGCNVPTAQLDPATGFTNILTLPTETLLIGILMLMVATGLIIARAFARWVHGVEKAAARRDEIDRSLMGVIHESEKAIKLLSDTALRAAAASEATAQRVIGMDASVKSALEQQNQRVLPALRAMWNKLIAIETKIDTCPTQELHAEIRALRADLRAAVANILPSSYTDEDEDTRKITPIYEES
jgi:hypothetical protein